MPNWLTNQVSTILYRFVISILMVVGSPSSRTNRATGSPVSRLYCFSSFDNVVSLISHSSYIITTVSIRFSLWFYTILCHSNPQAASARFEIIIRTHSSYPQNSVCPFGHDAIIEDSLKKCKPFQNFFLKFNN